MEAPEHTPGPWVIKIAGRSASPQQRCRAGHRTPYFRIESARLPVVTARGIARPSQPDGEANARLIAAAPDMHDALSYIAHTNDWFGQQRFAEDTDADFLLRVLQAVRGQARTALAKAAPRSPEAAQVLASSPGCPPKSESDHA